MDDDLEYFISFPTPKPYINSLNRKFSSKPLKKSPPTVGNKLSRPTTIAIRNDLYPTTVSITVDKSNNESSNNTNKNSHEIYPSSLNNDVSINNEEVLLSVSANGVEQDEDEESDSSCQSDFDEDFGSSGNELPFFGSSGGREPVVLLLGWMGAEDKHLAKYAALYTARGCISMRYTAPPSYLYFRNPGSYMAPLAEKLVAVLREMHLHSHPLICHAFSNHGATLYYFISKALESDTKQAEQQKEEPIVLRGCIFDSSPAPRKVWSGVCAVYSAFRGPKWVRLIAAVGSWFYLVGWSLIGLLVTIATGKLPKRLPWALIQEKRRVPQLFLYSEADLLISTEDIHSFSTERQRLGVHVVTKCWPQSPHVQHYRWYPEEYSRTVFQFLTLCLTGQAAPPAPEISFPAKTYATPRY